MTYKLGRLPVDHDKPKLHLSTLLAAAPPVPTTIDYLTDVDDWPMYGNDTWGDCVEAAMCHATEAFTRYGQGTTTQPAADTGEKLYEAITGFNPNDPNSDQGTNVQDALGYWRKTGVDGDTIVAFAAVDYTKAAEVAAALYYFGHLLIGFNFPAYAMDQFNAGEPWHVQTANNQIDGGHCVNVGGIVGANYQVVTWAQVQEMDGDFFAKYVEEAWVIVTHDWINAVSGDTPAGMDLAGFGEEFSTLTGDPNPFPGPDPTPVPDPPPVPDPGPVPDPTPAPAPGPAPDDVTVALARALHRIRRHPLRFVSRREDAAIDAWLEETGL